MPGHRQLRALFVALAVSSASGVATAEAQDAPLPPDPAIGQYVETMPTSSGNQAKEKAGSVQGTEEGTPRSSGSMVSSEALWLGSAIAVLTAAAILFALVRARSHGA